MLQAHDPWLIFTNGTYGTLPGSMRFDPHHYFEKNIKEIKKKKIKIYLKFVIRILNEHFSAWKQKSAPSPGAPAPAPASNNNVNSGDKDKEKNPNVDIDHSMAACRLTGSRRKGRNHWTD